jgi:hypothetical protein
MPQLMTPYNLHTPLTRNVGNGNTYSEEHQPRLVLQCYYFDTISTSDS